MRAGRRDKEQGPAGGLGPGRTRPLPGLGPRTASRAGGTLVVGQSGGATAVVNASLVGVVEGALATARFDRVLGMRHGIEGLLRGDLVDLGRQPVAVLERVRRTPSAALGTGRYRLGDDDLGPALSALRDLDARALVYIGGNDSADTAHRLHDRALVDRQPLAVVAVPKTIDNDLPETDHCPGYPSLARYLAHAVRDATYDTLASPQLYPVKFVEVMGRDAGWVPAAAGLAFAEDEADLRPLLYLPEHPPADLGAVLAEVEARVAERGWAVAVVPETLRDAAGTPLGGETVGHVDAFGHPYPVSPAALLTRLTAERLGLHARYDKPGTAARMSVALASPVDQDEAYRVGWAAAWRVAAGDSDLMVTLVRAREEPFASTVGAAPLAAVANRVRTLPAAFVGADGRSASAAFRRWALPLLGPDPFPAYGRLLA